MNSGENKIFYKYSYSTYVGQISFLGNGITAEDIIQSLTPKRTRREEMKSSSVLQVVHKNEIVEANQVVGKNSTVLIRRVPVVNSRVMKSKSQSNSSDVYVPPPPLTEENKFLSSMLPNGYSVLRKKKEGSGSMDSTIYYADKNTKEIKEFPNCFLCKLCENIFQQPMNMPCCGETYCYSCLYFLNKNSVLTCPSCNTDALLSDPVYNKDLIPLINQFFARHCQEPVKKEVRKRRKKIGRRRNYRKNDMYMSNTNANYYNNQNNGVNNQKSSKRFSNKRNISGFSNDSNYMYRTRVGTKRKRKRLNERTYYDQFEVYIDPSTMEPKKKKRKI